MKAYKVKTKTSVGGKLTPFGSQPAQGSVKVQAVYYSNLNPAQALCLYDGDGDMFMYPVPGQLEAKVVTPEIPVTVKLPLYYLDQDLDGENEVIVFGEVD